MVMNRRKFLSRGLVGAVTVAGMAAVGMAPEAQAEPLGSFMLPEGYNMARAQQIMDMYSRGLLTKQQVFEAIQETCAPKQSQGWHYAKVLDKFSVADV